MCLIIKDAYSYAVRVFKYIEAIISLILLNKINIHVVLSTLPRHSCLRRRCTTLACVGTLMTTCFVGLSLSNSKSCPL